MFMRSRRQPSALRLCVRAIAVCGLLVGLFFMHVLTSEHGGQLPAAGGAGHGSSAVADMASTHPGVEQVRGAPAAKYESLGNHGLGVMCLAILTIGLIALLRRSRGRRFRAIAQARRTQAFTAMAGLARGSPEYLRPTPGSLGISRT